MSGNGFDGYGQQPQEELLEEGYEPHIDIAAQPADVREDIDYAEFAPGYHPEHAHQPLPIGDIVEQHRDVVGFSSVPFITTIGALGLSQVAEGIGNLPVSSVTEFSPDYLGTDFGANVVVQARLSEFLPFLRGFFGEIAHLRAEGVFPTQSAAVLDDLSRLDPSELIHLARTFDPVETFDLGNLMDSYIPKEIFNPTDMATVATSTLQIGGITVTPSFPFTAPEINSIAQSALGAVPDVVLRNVETPNVLHNLSLGLSALTHEFSPDGIDMASELISYSESSSVISDALSASVKPPVNVIVEALQETRVIGSASASMPPEMMEAAMERAGVIAANKLARFISDHKGALLVGGGVIIGTLLAYGFYKYYQHRNQQAALLNHPHNPHDPNDGHDQTSGNIVRRGPAP